MAGSRRGAREESSSASKNVSSNHTHPSRTTRLPTDYYFDKMQLKGQHLTIQAMRKDLADKVALLDTNALLLTELVTTTTRCNQLQGTLLDTEAALNITQQTLDVREEQLAATIEELEQLQEHAKQQAANIAALEARNRDVETRLQDTERKLDITRKVLVNEQQASAATKQELGTSQTQLVAVVTARNHLSKELAKVWSNPIGSMAASLAAASNRSCHKSAFGVMTWLLMVFICATIVPMTLLMALPVVAGAAIAAKSLNSCVETGSTVLASWVGPILLGAAQRIWSAVGSAVTLHSAAIIPDGIAFILQLRSLLVSKLSQLDSAVCELLDSVLVAGCCDVAAADSVTEESAPTCNRLVGSWGSNCDSSTASSRQVSRAVSFEERGVAGSDDSSSSRYSGCDVVVEVHLVNAGMKVGSVVGDVCSDALLDDVAVM